MAAKPRGQNARVWLMNSDTDVGQPILAAGGLQPAFLFLDEFLRLRSTMLRDTKPEKMPANGLFSVNGGLKGRLQARLPATKSVRSNPGN